MKLQDLDLNLLRVLDALLREGSATAAANRLSVSQPTVSFSLNKLRAAFDDQLFIKTPQGMEPTPRALELAEPVGRVLEAISRDILSGSDFDPRTTDRQFNLITGEIGEFTLIPALVLLLRKEAPAASLRVISPPPQEREAVLEEGKADLAIGYYPEIRRPVFYQQTLFAHELVCVLRRKHPALSDGTFTLDDFRETDLAVFGTESSLHVGYEAELKRSGLFDRVALELAHVASAPHILASTDLVGLVPESVGELYCRDRRLRMVPPPLPLPPQAVKQSWHRRMHGDPAHLWLRRLVASTFSSPGREAVEPGTRTRRTGKTRRTPRGAPAS